MKTALSILFASLVASATAQEHPFIPTDGNSWVPDLGGSLFSESPIDLRGWNENVAGEHGFVRVSEDGRGFVRGDGQPIRFWAAHASEYPKGWTRDQEREYARGLARMGVNLALAGWLPKPAPGQDNPAVVDPVLLDQVWRRVAALKEQGIYSTLRGAWFHSGDIYFDKTLQGNYRAWIRDLFTRENPYTGIPLKDDPAVVSFTAFNELTWLFINYLKGDSLLEAQTRFAGWAAAKYGSPDAALAAWEHYAVEGDAPAEGRLGLIHWWIASEAGRKQHPAALPRLRDQAEFVAESQRAYYADLNKWLREEVGVQQLLLTSNFRPTDTGSMADLENWIKSVGDVVAINSYPGGSELKGEKESWAVLPGQFFRTQSITEVPLEIPQVKRQAANRPFWVTETMWPNPHEYANEGPLLSAIYANVCGQTAASFAGPRSIRWDGNSPFRGNNHYIHRWDCSEPGQFGSFPAAAMIARKGYGVQNRPAVLERRSLDKIFSLDYPLLPDGVDYDPNQDRSPTGEQTRGTLPPEAFLMGPVLTEFTEGKDEIAPEVLAYDGGPTIRSLDGTVVCNRERGLVTLDTPAAQAAIGLLRKAGPVRLSDVAVESSNEHLGVVVIALDDQPIASSKSVFVQLSPRAKPTGWTVEPAERQGEKGWRITDIGKPPYRIEKVEGTLRIDNPNLSTATLLTPLGEPMGSQPLNRSKDSVQLKLPTNTLYILLK